MRVTVTTEAATVDVRTADGYSPDVMNDLCTRALALVVEVHQRLAALELPDASAG